MKVARKIKHWLLGISLVIMGGGLNACTGVSDIDWKEEVRLSDGRIIIIEREVTLLGGASRSFLPEVSTGKIDAQRIRFRQSNWNTQGHRVAFYKKKLPDLS